MNDYDLARAFADRIASKGFGIEYWNDGHFIVISFLTNEAKSFMDMYFQPDGDFYCISGYTSGYWQDEVDWRKY